MRRTKVSSHTTASSKPGRLVCPACEFGELQPRGEAYVASCDVCNCAFTGAVLRILEQIAALPDALGKHACEECYHPEMRLLPDGTFHCPACRSEVRAITGSISAPRVDGVGSLADHNTEETKGVSTESA
jgi:ribosomal protein L37AE/L43A